MIELDVFQHKLNVDEIDLKGDASHKGKSTEYPRGGMVEELAHQKHPANGQWDIDHTFCSWWKSSVAMAFYVNTIPEGEDENNPHQTSPRGGFLLLFPSGELVGGFHQLSCINT